MRSGVRLGVLILLAIAVPSLPAAEKKVDAPRTGRFELRFTTPSTRPAIDVICARLGEREKPPELKLADEVYQVYVPETYKPGEPFGLFVFVSPSPRGLICSQEWLEVLKKHRLIWISADKSGNDRPVIDRVRLAIEAVQQMKGRYSIDERRIYVGGLSGGGKVAAISAIAFGDVFTGSFPICGVVFYRNIPTGTPNRFYPAAFPQPPDALLGRIKSESRHVLLTGEKDFNRESTLQFYVEGFQKQRFKHVTLLDVPGLGHTLPPAEWFEKGIEALDAVDPADAGKGVTGNTPAARPASGTGSKR